MKAADIALLSLGRLKSCGSVGVGTLLTITVGGGALLSVRALILCSPMVGGLFSNGAVKLLLGGVSITLLPVPVVATL